MPHFALTIIGRDRPGIVSQVTEILYRLGCNIADSSCSILGGQFAMILIISHPEYTDRASFGDVFAPLEETNLSVFLRTLRPGGEKRPDLPGEICMISVYGSDKPGIVYRVAKELGDRRINITDLNTKLIGSESRPVYVMMIEAVLPDDLSSDDLTHLLDHLKEALQVDISVRSITPVEL
ncbi:glycine cleavage system transcriptional repressor [Geoalkalibacter ferrihydriticus]|uniref:Amino acid-binding protein n=2 Tax=Geoalkalibacter ferrihydriticus TaxID=392333 RepID=A0A0C2HTP0_9BACT|nr:ACT domain-containing protein [Geoalkalibacter ferrihydriticus]KIH76202.1 amino acid-binding protein [Geoalkalibacter ferrihydriticus DSM 17813]SDL27584.1 glycine cleavage system transcriptional repressor [Geoalkalibacter ferrihydriticus]